MQINLNKVDSIHLSNFSGTNNAASATENKQQDKSHKLRNTLVGLAAAGAVIVIGVKIHKSKTADKVQEQVYKLLDEINFNNGIATVKENNEKFTGIIRDTLKNNDTITMKYTDGILEKSTRQGSATVEKVFETLENGTRKVTATKNGIKNEIIIDEIKNAAQKSQEELNALLANKDKFSIEEFKKQADNIKFKSENQDKNIKNIISEKQKVLDEKKAAMEKARIEAEKKINEDIGSKDNFLSKLLYKTEDKAVNVAKSDTYLSQNEQTVFDIYFHSYPDNVQMRRAKGNYNSHITNIMDAGFKKAPALEEDAVVYRVVAPMDLEQRRESLEFINSLKKDSIIKDYAYMSTSTNIFDEKFQQFALKKKDKGDSVFMRIHLPKGTKGVSGGDNEYLLPRNSELKVISTKLTDGLKVADCEYILPTK